VSVFDYDCSLPLDYEEIGLSAGEGFTVRDVRYASPLGGKVPAYLVEPDGPGPFAAIVYVHHGLGDRKAFLSEAEILAGAGVVSLLPDAPHIRTEARRSSAEARAAEVSAAEVGRAEGRMYIQLVVDVRRGLDLLLTRPDVSHDRIGYVGHSLGATWGGPLAGAERRVRAYVLMAGYPSLTEAYRSNPHPFMEARRSQIGPERLEAYLAPLAPLDAVHWIHRAAPAHLFFQFARRDEFITRREAEAYYEAASSPRRVVWYDADHLFTGAPEARLERARWLAERLGFAPLEDEVLARLAVSSGVQ